MLQYFHYTPVLIVELLVYYLSSSITEISYKNKLKRKKKKLIHCLY